MAGQRYAEAQEARYSAKQLVKAIELYVAVTKTHPNTPEADYSRTQVLNIVNHVVPQEGLFDAQLALALEYLRRGEATDLKPAQVKALASAPSS